MTSYSRPNYPVFVGSRRQVGGGIFGALGRILTPMVKKYGIPILKTMGKNAVKLGSNVVADTLQGENFKDSLKTRAKQSAINTLDDLSSTRFSKRKKRKQTRQVGSGRVYKQQKRTRQVVSGRVTKQKKQSQITRKSAAKSRKRSCSTKTSRKTCKRRRVAYL